MSRGASSLTRSELRKIDLGASTVSVPGAGATAQPPDFTPDPWTPNNAVNPPLNLDHLAALTNLSGVRRSCIAAIALNTVGLGYELPIKPGHEDDVEGGDPEAEEAQIRETLDGFARRDVYLGRPNFVRQLGAAKWDEQEVGNAYIEVSRNRVTGEIDGLYHVPGKRIRRRSDIDGWIMGPRVGQAADYVRFYDFGAKVAYDDDGRPTSTLARKGLVWETNELIPFQLYTSASRYYGLPADAHLAVDYLGDKLAADANVGYFDSSGVPPTVIFVQGTPSEDEPDTVFEVDQSLIDSIANTLKNTGPKNRRVAIVPVPPGTKTEKHDLAVLSERDLGFVNFRGDNRRRTLGAFRIAPIFVADIEDAGKYTSDAERGLTKEQVFDPEQERWQDILAITLLAEIAPHREFKFRELAIEGDSAKRASANDLAAAGRITNGELREAHGFPPLPEAAPGAPPNPELGEVPNGWNAELVPAVKAISPALSPDTIPDGRGLLKSAEDDLAAGVRETFAGDIDEALHRVADLAGTSADALRGVVVEKDGDRITVTPVGAG